MRIFLAEPDPDLRVGLQFLIYQNPGCQVIGISDNGKGLKKQIKASRPDVLLLDWYLPGKDMNELVRDIKALNLPPDIIAMSIYPEDESAVRAADVDHFIAKDVHPEELIALLNSMKSINGEPNSSKG
jgi:DNA-binding NarL/FixJ family response regulator